MFKLVDKPDFELRFIRGLTTRVPRIHKAGVLANLLASFYGRKPHQSVRVRDEDGITLELNPNESLDRGILFYPQLYDRKEIAFIQKVVRPGDTCLDCGAHIGFYSLQIAKLLRGEGRVIAIEADPETAQLCQKNVRLSQVEQTVKVINAGLSDTAERLTLYRNLGGNLSGNRFVNETREGNLPPSFTRTELSIACYPLDQLLLTENVETIRLMKMDIEGFEYKVLRTFFMAAPRTLYPEFMIIEENPQVSTEVDQLSLLIKENGYELVEESSLNKIYRLSRPA